MVLLVAAGAAVGAPARYVSDVLLTRSGGGRFPVGTLAVNLTGSFVLGLVTGLGLHHDLSPGARALLGVGFCGTFTTFSTFSLETVALLRAGRPRAAAANLVGSTLLGLALAAAGLGLALL